MYTQFVKSQRSPFVHSIHQAAEKAIACTHNSSGTCTHNSSSHREDCCMYTQFVKLQRRQLHVHTSCQVADMAVACTHNNYLSSRREGCCSYVHTICHFAEKAVVADVCSNAPKQRKQTQVASVQEREPDIDSRNDEQQPSFIVPSYDYGRRLMTRSLKQK